MQRIATGAARYVHEFVDAKVAFDRRSGAYRVCFIGEADVQGFAIDIAENGGGADAQLAAGAQNAHGNLSAIGDQDFSEHGLRMRGLGMWAAGLRFREILACEELGRWTALGYGVQSFRNGICEGVWP